MKKNKTELKIFAEQIRKATLQGLSKIGAGHVGGSMSMAELMAVLYGGVMHVDPSNPKWEARDKLVVSKGHCGPAVYGALALTGFFPMEELYTVNQPKTRLPSHCDMNKTPGVDMTTGSLAQGMSTALGLAWGDRYQKRENYVYLILGDGEIQEGQVWEAALFAYHQKLDHVIAFVDCNGKQLDGYTKDVCDLGAIDKKFDAFGWNTQVCNGNDISEILDAIDRAKAVKGVPHLIILETEKGLGCTFTEGILYNHHVVFTQKQYEEAIAEIDKRIEKIKVDMRSERNDQK
ncbi:MAG: transketolase [Lachnospiraceae bacterium]|nr:transketolase [Lachnospiraceae bacterium]